MLSYPITVRGLHDWLLTQNPATRYSYVSNEKCLIAQFLRASGYPVLSVNPVTWTDKTGASHYYPQELNEIALDRDKSTDRTFGAALKRAAKVLRKNPEA